MTPATTKIVTTDDHDRISPAKQTPRQFTEWPGEDDVPPIGAVAMSLAREMRETMDLPLQAGESVDDDRETLEQFAVPQIDGGRYPFFRVGATFHRGLGAVRALKRERERRLAEKRKGIGELNMDVVASSGTSSDDGSDSSEWTPDLDSHEDIEDPSPQVDESEDEDEPVEGDPEYDPCGPGKYNIESCECCGCPDCGGKSIYKRKTKEPPYRCRNPDCNNEFNHPDDIS